VVLLVASSDGGGSNDDEFCKIMLDDARLKKNARTYECKSKPLRIFCIVLKSDEQLDRRRQDLAATCIENTQRQRSILSRHTIAAVTSHSRYAKHVAA